MQFQFCHQQEMVRRPAAAREVVAAATLQFFQVRVQAGTNYFAGVFSVFVSLHKNEVLLGPLQFKIVLLVNVVVTFCIFNQVKKRIIVLEF